ncbi:TPA: SET domain-containing protein, partial [Salmonella enterica]|nr:SET domain-containing protein [Salmonella enterica]
MRGIGAVIHFGPPTGSIAPSPDVSGRWSSIRDWFSLPVQDEAALCFHVFYQPDEATSPSDRLKNFLKLKALASPGRQDNFTAERTLGTGETICMIASGKNSDFPPVTLHLSDQEWHTAQLQELAPAAESGESPRSKGIPITSTQIQAWLDLPQEAKRDAGGWRKWTRTQGITLGSAGLCLTNTGLTPYGRERLHPPKERGLPITVVQLRTWRDLSVEARSETGGWVKWALAQGIAITSAKKHLTNTGLTLYGMERLQRPEERGATITKAQILTWLNMPPEERNQAGGWITWAQAQGIATNSARLYLSNTGLTARGMARLQLSEEKGFPITDRQIQAWRDLPQATKHQTGGWAKWALAQEISITSAKKYLTNTGLTLPGVEMLQPPGEKTAPITESQLLAWLNMSAQEHNETGGWRTWAQTQKIAINSARKYLTNTGLTPRGMERLQRAEEKDHPITNRQIQAWQDLPQATKLEIGGWKKWAQEQGITIGSAIACLTNTGLTFNGRKRLLPPEERGSTITEAQFLKWADMSPEERSEAGGWRAWAQAQGISIRSAGNVLTNSGLTPFGTERLKSPEERGAPITNVQIRTWRDLPQEAKRQAGGWIKWAQAQEIAIGSASGYLTNTGLKANGMARLRQSPSATVTLSRPQASTSADTSDEIPVSESPSPQDSEDIAAPPAKQIKEEDVV